MTAPIVAKVSACAVTDCAYNVDGCRAYAVSVNTASECSTYIPRADKAGMPEVNTQVGACQRASCIHNMDLECVAMKVQFASVDGVAECLSYVRR